MSINTRTGVYIKQSELDKIERATNKLVKAVGKEKQTILLTQARKVRDRIKLKAPLGPTGNLKKAAYAAGLPERVGKPAVAFAGIRPRKAPHAHLVEFGTVQRAHRSGKSTGNVPARPFIRPAWDEMKGEVNRAVESQLKRTINGAV